jgi:phosphate transport system permease protein
MMTQTFLATVLLGLSALGFYLGQAKSRRVAVVTGTKLHSLPTYHGWYVAIWAGVPSLALFALWVVFEDYIVRALVVRNLPADILALPAGQLGLVISDIRNMAQGNVASGNATPAMQTAVAHYKSLHSTAMATLWVLGLAVAIAGMAYGHQIIQPALRVRNYVERVLMVALIVCSTLAVLTTIGIVLSLLFESLQFFARVSPIEFLFGTTWSPQTAIRADQVGSSGAFGAIPLFTGTLVIAAISMLVAVPTGLMAAIYMADYAPTRMRNVVKPILEILAGIPTVVFGFFAALTVAPAVQQIGEMLGLHVAAQSALAAGLVMGIMIIPYVSSLSDDVINAVPQSLRDGSYGLGATKSETIRQVVLPAALPGITAAIIIAFSRAVGETMIVVMAAGLAANISVNPLAAMTTVTVHIAALLVGDQEFDSAKTLSAFALGLVLFLVTLALNIAALRIVRKYKEQYE